MDDNARYFEANRQGWNLRTPVHTKSAFYNVDAWKAGAESLTPIELAEVSDVRGKRLLHLQCHFGQDTLSWARKGARVTGVDISDAAIACARELAAETTTEEPATFVCCNVFDIVFTSYGTIGWLPDLVAWAKVISHYLKPGGFFYIAEFHPVLWMLDDEMKRFAYPYHNAGVIETQQRGTYTDRDAPIAFVEYGWNHPLGDVVNALVGEGLQIAFLNEYAYSPFPCFQNSVRGEDGNYRIKGLEGILPMVYSLKATRPSLPAVPARR